ncbi:S8 family serine peptidase [Natronosalvus vescus]|uniref:S8 family serine peptidase n=1 Tax=Natronosalvus vescus TaxID=2953881 RepID=UPI0020904154|nr:S8 family serine peptidase [Natronosalvus vescus]
MSDNDNYGFDRRSVLKGASALGAFFGLGGVVTATPGRNPGPKEDEIVVGLGVSVADAEATLTPALPEQAEIVHRNETLGYVAVKLPEQASAQARENVKNRVEAVQGVEYAEDNATYEALLVPNDPMYGQQYAPQQVGCEEAWDTTLGDPGVTISIIDQGIQYDHPNLAENMDGSVSNYGYDFVDNNGDPYPVTQSENHGTHVGGIAAAGTNNGEGHAGISNCSMLSARALNSQGGGSLTDIADAIQWSGDQGADIINMSLGGGGFNNTMNNACEYAYSQGSLLIAAAGNDSGSVNYPAAYDSVMAVSAIDENENLANFSSRGPEIELAAPGVDVLSTVNWDDYQALSGTSMASPVAAGVAALAKSAHPSMSNDQLRSHLQETAVDIGLPGDHQGAGRVDAANAVSDGGGDPPESPTAVIDVSDTNPDVGDAVELDGTGSSSPNGSITEYYWNAEPGGSATGSTVTLQRDEEVDVTVSLTITDEDGQTDTDSVTVSFGGDGGGQCGAEVNTASAEGYLSGGWYGNPSDTYSYALQTSDPCHGTVTLDGPSDATFDLYLTLDGRTPTTTDYDERSYNWGADEEISVDLDGDESFGILVDRWDGEGSYTLTVEELGK